MSERQDWYRSILGNAPSAIYRLRCDDELTVEYVSGWIEHITGWPAAAFEQRSNLYSSIVYPDDRDLVAQLHQSAREADEAQALSYRVIHADGGVRWVLDRCRSIRSASGDLLWIDGVVVDQTAQKRVEEALAYERDLLRMFLDNAPDAVYFK